MSAASFSESLDSGNAGMIEVSVLRNFLTKLPKPILSSLISGALPSLPLGPWQAEQLCIIYHRFPFSTLPSGPLQAAIIGREPRIVKRSVCLIICRVMRVLKNEMLLITVCYHEEADIQNTV